MPASLVVGVEGILGHTVKVADMPRGEAREGEGGQVPGAVWKRGAFDRGYHSRILVGIEKGMLVIH